MFDRRRPTLIAPTLAALLALAAGGGALAASPPTTFVAEQAADRAGFGAAVDVSGGQLAVGAPSADLAEDDAGAVFLFDAASDGVVQLATLVAGDAELASSFGASVALEGDVVLVGAPSVLLAELNEGAAYLFERDGDAWTEVAKLRRETPGRNDMFGASVALDDGVAVVGAPGADVAATDSGAAFVYERRDGGWARTATLAPEGAAAGARFGSAVAIDGGRILIGASGDVPSDEDVGSAHLFERTGDGWRRAARWTPSDGRGGDGFGDAVAIAGDLAVVGARFADLAGADEGAAYVFERTADGWREAGRVTAPDPADRDQFGRAVALAGEVVLVSAPRVDDPERDAGGVWAFARGDEGWRATGRLSPAAAPEAYDEFGGAVAADGSVAVVGASQDIPADATDQTATGTATLFRGVR